MSCSKVFSVFCKSPDEVLDYVIDWTDWLSSETITTSTWTVPSGITQGVDSNTDTAVTIWLSGGTLVEKYLVVNEIVTSAGRTATRAFYIQIATR